MIEGIRTTITETSHNDYHDNPVYHFEKEKTTAKLINYATDPNNDIEYQITDDEATKILYGALFVTLLVTIINILFL
jgi:hypothetical protein